MHELQLRGHIGSRLKDPADFSSTPRAHRYALLERHRVLLSFTILVFDSDGELRDGVVQSHLLPLAQPIERDLAGLRARGCQGSVFVWGRYG